MGSYVAGGKISQASQILLIPYEEKPQLSLESPPLKPTAKSTVVREVLGKQTMTHSCNMCYK